MCVVGGHSLANCVKNTACTPGTGAVGLAGALLGRFADWRWWQRWAPQEQEPFHSSSWHVLTFLTSPGPGEAKFRTSSNRNCPSSDFLLQSLCVLLPNNFRFQR